MWGRFMSVFLTSHISAQSSRFLALFYPRMVAVAYLVRVRLCASSA